MAAQAEEARKTYVPRGSEAQIRWLEQIHANAIDYKSRRTENWSKSAEIYRGNNWDTKRDGNPFFKTNIARSKLDRKAAKLVTSKPIIAVLPRRPGMTQAGRVIQRVINALWDSLDIQMRLEQLSTFVRPFGCGFFKTVWDPREANGLGDIVVAEIDPRNVALDPYTLRAYDIKRSLILIHESSVPFTWVRDNFPRHANEVEDFNAPPPAPTDREVEQGIRFAMGGPIRTPLRSYLGGLRTTGQPGSTVSPIPYVRVREFWYADPLTINDEPIYPNGRVTYLVGSGRKACIVNPEQEASKNAFFDGMIPFDMYDARPDTDHPWGSSQVEDIRRLEEALNRSGHMAIRNLIKNVAVVIADSGALTPDYLKRLSDFGDVVINKMGGREVRREPAVNAIGESINLGNFVIQLMDTVLGLGGDSPVSGRGRVEVRSPDLLYGLQQGSDLINVEARRMESFLERVGTKMVSRIIQFYHKDRFIPYLSGGSWQQYLFEVKALRQEIHQVAFQSVAARLADINDGTESERQKRKVANFDMVRIAVEEALRGAWKEFNFKIVPLSSLATTRAARAKVISEFVQSGEFPMRMLVEEAGFDNFEDLQKEAIEEKKKLALEYQAAGMEPPPPPGQKKPSSRAK